MPTHIVSQGECISSIAHQYGFFWKTLWDRAENAALKQKRGDPNVLWPGDEVFIPELQIKEVSRAAKQKHRFRRKGEPAKLKLRLLKEEPQEPEEDQPSDPGVCDLGPQKPRKLKQTPRANVPYRLIIDGVSMEGQSDSDGYIKETIPPGAVGGTLILYPGTDHEEQIAITLGAMDPKGEWVGIRKRLNNLGFVCALAGNEMTDDLHDALAGFQEAYGLDVTGKLDDATRDKLVQAHGV